MIPRKDALINLAVATISLFIPLTVADIILKSMNLPADNSRIMLLSDRGLATSANTGTRRYKSNSRYRHVAIYGQTVEYDYYFQTDPNGFRLTYDCPISKTKFKLPNNKYQLAIAGDSFTEGQGSNLVWISSVQKEVCRRNARSVNTSMAGVGILEMSEELAYSRNNFKSQKAIVAIISNDILREKISMFSNSECSAYETSNSQIICGKSATWWHIKPTDTDNQIIAYANKKYDHGLIPSLKRFAKILKNLVYYKKNNVNMLSGQDSMIRSSASAMNKIINSYGEKNILLVILPTKLDAKINGNNTELSKEKQIVKMFLNNLQQKPLIADLRQCSLSDKDFFKLDGHPNSMGHYSIAKCFNANTIAYKFINSI